MLTLVHHTTDVHQRQFSSLEALLDAPFPQTPEDRLQLEQRLLAAAAQVADQIVLVPLSRAHEAEAFVTQAMAQARAQSPVPLVHKGVRTTSVLLLGGTRLVFETPSLREDRRGRRGRPRRTRGPRGAGCSPVLAALGIADRVSPATRSEIALHVVQAARSREAAEMLARRGLSCDVSSLVRLSTAMAATSTRLRDAALEAALPVPVPRDGPLAGKRVRMRLDGGRVRIRRTHRGRKTAKGRHGFSTPWREPRVLVIDVRDAQGQPDRLCVPLSDALLGDAEATWALVLGSLRRLGAAHAEVVEWIADGAEWMWDRTARLTRLAEMPAAKLVEVLDCSHASHSLYETVETCRGIPQAQRQALDERLRHARRHNANGIEVVMDALRTLATTRRGKVLKRALGYCEAHAQRMRYATRETHKLPMGSGQVESAVRRVITLRVKAPGSFWTEARVSGLMHLRAAFKAGRWDDVLGGVVTGTFHVPSFEPVGTTALEGPADAQCHDTTQTILEPRKKAA